MTELNTLLGLPKDFPVSSLQVGKTYTVTKDRERSFPLHIALLLVDANWNFYGYCQANKAITENGKTTLEFTVILLFTEVQKKIYRDNFIYAAKQTGEIK